MSKYIDADKAKNGIMAFVNKYGEIVGMFVNDFNILLERCAADVVEVVRCKDCKYLDYVDENEKWCMGRGNPATMVKDDGYCEIGKRKEEFCSNGKARD